MQNNIVFNSEEEALRNAGLSTGVNAGVNTGVTQHLPGQHQHHHHHQHQHGTEVLANQLGGTHLSGNQYISDPQLLAGQQQYIGGGVPLVGGTNLGNAGLVGGEYVNTGIVGGQYSNTGLVGGQYGNTGIVGDQFSNAGLVGGQYNTGLVGGPYNTTGLVGAPLTGVQGSHLTGNQLLGAGAIGAGAVGAGVLGSQAVHHHHGVGTTAGTSLGANTALSGSGLGTFIFRPLQGKFIKDKDIVGKMDCYCKFKIGFHSGKSAVAKSEGTIPTWTDVISLNRKHNEQFAKLKIKDKDRLSLNDKVGEVKIPLNEIAAKGRVQQWFNVYKKDQLAGEILLDVEYQPRTVF